MNIKTSQTATEYLIITAVVIIIALVVVSVLGGIPGLGGGVSEQQMRLQLQILPIGVTDYVSNSLHTQLWLQNNVGNNVRITGITVDGKQCSFRSRILRSGQNELFECWGVRSLQTDRYQYPIEITYTDVSTSASYTVSDTSVFLIGEGLGGTRLHTGQTTCYTCTNNCGLGGGISDEGISVQCDESHKGQDAYHDATQKQFTVLSDNVLRDELTRLYWTSNYTNNMDRNQAHTYCETLEQGSFDDWRLPNIVELFTVMNADSEVNPSPNGAWLADENEYWSSTTLNGYYWRLIVLNGYFRSHSGTSTNPPETTRTVCVRGESSSVKLNDGTGGVEKAFKDLGDGTVVDIQTGIIWDKNVSDNLSYQDAITFCNNLQRGGFTDWRAPTAFEVKTIIDYGCASQNSRCEDTLKNAAFNWDSGTNALRSSTNLFSTFSFSYVTIFDIGLIGITTYFFNNIWALPIRCVR